MDLVMEEINSFFEEDLKKITGFELENYVSKEDEYELSGIKLSERFGVPPFSVLDTRQGYWLDRKRHWKTLILDEGESREGTLANEDSLMGEINSGVSILDPVLAELAVNWFCTKDGKTFDPFAGDTVFGFVSASKGNPFTGIELREEQASINNKRTSEAGLEAKYICDDGQNVAEYIKPESMDMLFSCPPYFDLEVYSEKDNDASNQDSYEDFLVILKNAFTNAVNCLKEDRFAVIVVGDIRDKKGIYRGFPDDIKSIFKQCGMQLYNEMILVESLGTLPQRVGQSMKNRKVGKCHQNVIVFYKGNPKLIKSNFPEIEYVSEDEQF